MTAVEATNAVAPGPQVWPLSVKAYHALGDLGLIPEKTELLYGQIFHKKPKSPFHRLLLMGLLQLLQRQRQQTKQMTRLAGEKTDLAAEKTELAGNLTRLGEENHNRILRLDIANGVRLLDEGDPAGALLWFADALSLGTKNPAEESIHRIRLQQTLDHSPRLVNVFPHPASVQCAFFSPDENQIATACDDGFVRIWDATQNDQPLREYPQPLPPRWIRYTRDGRRLLVVTAPTWLWHPPPLNLAVLDAATGDNCSGPSNWRTWTSVRSRRIPGVEPQGHRRRSRTAYWSVTRRRAQWLPWTSPTVRCCGAINISTSRRYPCIPIGIRIPACPSTVKPRWMTWIISRL